jgi:hypothetical protein
MRWIKELEVRRLAKYVLHSEAKRLKYPPSALCYDLAQDLSESFVFSVVNDQICVFVPTVLFYYLKHNTKEFVYDQNSVYIVFDVGVGTGLVRVTIHPDIVKAFKNNNHTGRILVGGFYKSGEDFLIQDTSEIKMDDLVDALFTDDSPTDESDDESNQDIFDVVDDHFVVPLIEKE